MGQPVLLYDGLCGFCDRTVQFILARDAGGPMHFAPLQGEYARQVLKEHPSLRGVDSLILVEAGAGRRTRRWCAPTPSSPSPTTSAGPGVRPASSGSCPASSATGPTTASPATAYRLFGRYDACPLPTPEVRARFID